MQWLARHGWTGYAQHGALLLSGQLEGFLGYTALGMTTTPQANQGLHVPHARRQYDTHFDNIVVQLGREYPVGTREYPVGTLRPLALSSYTSHQISRQTRKLLPPCLMSLSCMIANAASSA